MKHIIAVMVPDWIQGYIGQLIPKIIVSNHPRFRPGDRLDYGFLRIALEEGYTVIITPTEE